MCLIYYAAGNLLQATEEGGRRTGRWDRGEGTKVANLLGEKSLLSTSAFEGEAQVKANSEVRIKKNDPCLLFCSADLYLYTCEMCGKVTAALTLLWAFCMVFLWFSASGMEFSQARGESQNLGPRKQWAAEPSQTVMQRLANASLMSSVSLPSTNQSPTGSAHENMIAISHFLTSSFVENQVEFIKIT